MDYQYTSAEQIGIKNFGKKLGVLINYHVPAD